MVGERGRRLLSLSGSGREVGWGGGERLLTFSAFRKGASSRLGAYSNKYDIFSLQTTSFVLQ